MQKMISVIAAVLVCTSLAWLVYRQQSQADTAVQLRAAAPAAPVTAGVAEARDMPVYARGLGTVQAYRMVTVKSRVDGQIMAVGFTEGQEVKAGDLLFQIDPRPFQAALGQVVANKEKDEAQLVSAQADLQRYAQLIGSGFQTRQSYDNQKALVEQLQASIRADQAQIETAQLNLGFAEIRAPIDGRTGARLVDEGNLVHTGDNAGLVTITQLRPIYVSFTLPQGDLDRIRRNQANGALEVLADSQSDGNQLAAGRLTLIDNQVDQATGTIHLKATFDNRDEALWPGEFVNVRLVVSIDRNAVTVPARTVLRGPNGPYLYVIKPDLTAEMRSVEVSQVEHDVAVIARGLSAGERIVTDGQYRLAQGSRIEIQPPTTPAAPDAGNAARATFEGNAG